MCSTCHPSAAESLNLPAKQYDGFVAGRSRLTRISHRNLEL
jgi:hypothetical protein